MKNINITIDRRLKIDEIKKRNKRLLNEMIEKKISMWMNSNKRYTYGSNQTNKDHKIS